MRRDPRKVPDAAQLHCPAQMERSSSHISSGRALGPLERTPRLLRLALEPEPNTPPHLGQCAPTTRIGTGKAQPTPPPLTVPYQAVGQLEACVSECPRASTGKEGGCT